MAEKSSGSHSAPQTTTRNDSNSMTHVEIFKNLPLELIKSETIPPSPNRFDSSIDWLPDFSGLSWIAYGASSLLVISHFPSPLSHEETLIGPVYRQVIELSNDESSVVKSVAWSPVVPSEGEVAVAVENCICLCSESSRSTKGIFCWVQSGVLLQSNQVEAIKWTGSGDGIISVGINVVLWKRKSKTWEIAWKLKVEQPQTMVSATWSTEGPVSTGVRSDGSSFVDGVASRCVLVCQNDEKFGLVKAELRHPQPVLMIQWRPYTGKHSQRDILLTCCLDGTVRLWSEIGSGRGKKFGKDMNDVKGTRQLFHVIAVIEINQSIDGILGTNTFVVWAAEMGDMVSRREGIKQCPSIEGSEDGTPAKCEWLIGYGPGTLLTFWAIHCLDDISPLRFPRVTLWKRLHLQGVEEHVLQSAHTLNSKCHSLLVKATISRSLLYSPPIKCSLFQLFSNNCMSWSQQCLDSSDTKSELLTLDGHTGHIIQVAVHPYSSEVELAASLDSNGVLLFWSLSTISSCMLGIPPLVLPTWKLLGKMVTGDWTSSEYSSFKWAPSVLEDYNVLLMGHAGGIDCLMIKISEVEVQKIMCHKLCTIPFTDHSRVDGPTNIFAIPLPCTCRKTFVSNNFMLLGIWMKNFQALSWNVTLHSDDLSGSPCDCISSSGGIADYGTWRYEIILDGKKYSVVAVPGSSRLPDPQIYDQVTSVAVVSPGNMIPSIQQKLVPSDSLSSVAYHMATGCSDGSLKLWRSSPAKSSASQSDMDYLSWELLGTFQAHQGPVSAIALSCCGRKIATICTKNHLDSVSTLCISETVHVRGEGNFLLEDSISLNETIIAIDWLSIGNGQLLLGVCMQNELRIYAERTYDEETNVKTGETLGTHIWYCIAFGHTSLDTRDFLWGPGATPVLVHKRYFCLFSKWSFRMNKRHHAKCYAQRTKINSQHSIGGTDKDIFCENFIDCNICDINGLSLDEKSEKGTPILPSKINMRSDHPICNLFSTMTQHQYDSGMKTGCWNMLEVAERLRGALPIYHPEALLMNLYSGNSRRACAAVRHLVENITTNTFVTHEKTSEPTRPNRIIPQMLLSKYFEEPYSTSLGDDSSKLSRDSLSVMSAAQFQSNPIQFNGYSSDTYTFTSTSVKSEISGFVKTIEEFHDITAIIRMDRIQLLAILDLLSEVSGSHSGSPYESLDETGRRFWVAVRFQQLIFFRRFGRMVTMDEFVVDSSLMGWASHSDCQDNLFSSFLSTEPSWQEMRNLGVGFWFTNASQLRTRMEKLARAQYLKKKNPKDCALLYIALNRVQVLAGLFKISRDEKDKPLVGFLSRNFQDEKNKAAALKNAYVLMGRHQLDLAIAFFLLGGDTSSAVTICAKNLGDEQLALVLCRLIEGYGGPLGNHLISRILLPAATEKGDYWLASLLEWAMGNYSQSFLKLLGFQSDSLTNKSVLQCNQAAFLDPKVGQYGLVLATKNVMKNSVGEFTAATFARWVTLMTSIALNRCGLPVESLECLSSSLSTLETKDERSLSEIRGHEVVDSNPSDASNWLSGDVALHLESCYKLDLASQYISKLTMEHPSWPENNLASGVPLVCNVDETCQRELPLETFKNKLYVGIRFFEQKYLINSVDLTNMIFVFSSNNGLLFTGYHILHACTLREHPQDENHLGDSIYLYPPIVKLILKATEEISCLFARYLVSCSMSWSLQGSSSHDTEVLETDRSSCFNAWDVYIHAFVYLVKSLGLTLEIYYPSFLEENLIGRVNTALELIEYYVFLASAWRQKNLKVLILMIHPILLAYTDGHGPSEINIRTLKKRIHQNVELMICDSLADVGRASVPTSKQLQHEESGNVFPSIPEDERWLVIGACLWRLLFNFTKDQLKAPSDSMGDENSSSIPSLKSDNVVSSDSDVKTTVKLFQQVPVFLAMFLKRSLAFNSSSYVNQLGSCLCKKVKEGFLVPTLPWIEESNQSQPKSPRSYLNHGIDSLQLINNAKGSSLLEILWGMTADPKVIREDFLQEKICWSLFGTPKPSKVWTDIQKAIGENENGDLKIYGQGSSVSNNSGSDGGGKLHSESEDSKEIRSSKQKNSTTIKDSCSFQSPEEIYKRNGELLEAICINSIDRRQAALASNRKGILFFDWKDKKPSGYQSEYIWSNADWPQNGWAGSESTPVPTFVSPGIGLGSKKGTHLGLGGATIGLGSSVRPGRDLTGGGAFGIPGYAGIGAAGLGWGTQEDFDVSVDPPATIDNISTRTLSSHPSRPFFLAGSSNTHVYLWEFGKEKATATYGVLPAANVPPPYALASISALQFDRYGHRFVTAASDGTICTWQLEVGGRNNIHPTESSLCFKNHALDVTYVAGSGSVIAAAGYSSNDVNVVIWDTLAPAATSQASLICHEGGARSVSVFDNDIGSGSVSPLIVTGGRNGDVGLHDFRFIATGKTKRQRYSNTSEHETHLGTLNKHGEQNSKGMLWYIPKAHLGSVTRIATIPHTSLFLTGSKDGDVKLWDAKRAELIFHWPKLHERHTFLQPSTRGFGGVVRAAVTDIEVLSHGFLSCGGDGTVKRILLKDSVQIMREK